MTMGFYKLSFFKTFWLGKFFFTLVKFGLFKYFVLLFNMIDVVTASFYA